MWYRLAHAVNGCCVIVSLFTTSHSISNSPECALDAAGCDEKSQSALSLIQKKVSKSLTNKVHASPTPDDLVYYGHPSWLESCQSIYLDVGSNIGVQVRKLFEPGLYPNAPVLPFFTEKFGPPDKRCSPAVDSGLCALGFEPNPLWHSRLMSLTTAYNDKGWRAHFYPFAVGYEDGEVNFTIDSECLHNDWGARVADLQDSHRRMRAPVKVTAKSLDFGRFLKSLPLHKIRLMKMDIEGSEWNTIASMAEHGVLCAEYIQEAFIEVHSWGSLEHWSGNMTYEAIQTFLNFQRCSEGPIKLRKLDDETFHLDQDVEPWTMSACDAQALGS